MWPRRPLGSRHGRTSCSLPLYMLCSAGIVSAGAACKPQCFCCAGSSAAGLTGQHVRLSSTLESQAARQQAWQDIMQAHAVIMMLLFCLATAWQQACHHARSVDNMQGQC